MSETTASPAAFHLRELARDDLPCLLAWRNAPSIRPLMFDPAPITAEAHQRWFERVSLDPERHVLLLEGPAGPVGTVNFTPARHGAGVFEWGFYKAPQAPPGTGSVLGMLALDWIFQHQAHKVAGQVLAFNHASCRFHRKLGFVEEGRLRQHYRRDQARVDVLCYGLLSAEWRAARPSIAARVQEGAS